MTVPPPPSISPEQMNLLRIVCSMAWSDGELSAEEAELMLSHFSEMFATDEQPAGVLRQELQDYISQNIPLEELVPRLKTEEDRELMLKLGYLVIRVSRRTPNESTINPQEKAAYQRLVDLLGLPQATVEKVEWAANDELRQSNNDVIAALDYGLSRFFGR